MVADAVVPNPPDPVHGGGTRPLLLHDENNDGRTRALASLKQRLLVPEQDNTRYS